MAFGNTLVWSVSQWIRSGEVEQLPILALPIPALPILGAGRGVDQADEVALPAQSTGMVLQVAAFVDTGAAALQVQVRWLWVVGQVAVLVVGHGHQLEAEQEQDAVTDDVIRYDSVT